eukprot:TRINITY_DN6228_c0_g2_i1.p1 TRINITY_DN6228_c0_g2~~TRINITY_DN6228_c0_g2_i1.p1  ORF type:complete len:440 (-),score=134.89 TRINITY_DN6228_c0_g2_i1:62-1381(-)
MSFFSLTSESLVAQPKKSSLQKTKMMRHYWPGKAPQYATEEYDEEELALEEELGRYLADTNINQRSQRRNNREIVAEILQEKIKEEEIEESKREKSKILEEAETKQELEEEKEEEEEEEDQDQRRERIRQKYLQQKQNQDQHKTTEIENENENEEEKSDAENEEDREKSGSEYEDSSDEYTDESDEDDSLAVPLFRPVFIKKEDRKTIQDQNKEWEEEEKKEEEKKQLIAQRKAESKQMVKVFVEEDQKNAALAEAEQNSDDSEPEEEVDEEAEFEAWKLREIDRIRKYREERDRLQKEKEEVSRRRNMTDQEIIEEDPDKFVHRGQKDEGPKMRFMQRYYHKGAFFREYDGNDVQDKDFSAPTGEDAEMDKALLPKVLQVKKFGRIGRTKYTHLADQDTSVKRSDNIWAQDNSLVDKYKARMGGMEKPITKRKLDNGK